MPAFYCWDEDAGETREDAKRSEPNAYDPEEAAEDYAKKVFSMIEPFDEITVHVQPEGSNDLFVYEVTVEPVPHFHASLKRGRCVAEKGTEP